jgi:HD-GYP domain-containing protein (c-di-GMP phosphodiesterase class II)
MRGESAGVATLLGLNEPVLKDMARAKRVLDDPEALARMKAARQLLRADGVYVMNGAGDVMAHETERVSFTGKNFKYRPYFLQAMAGVVSIYAGVGGLTGERGLFVSAPIHADNVPGSAIVGALVVKLPADFLDAKLGSFGDKAVLLSPQGVVFASTDKDWLYRLATTPTPESVAAIRTLKQFGKVFEDSMPRQLPFMPGNEFVRLGDTRYAIAIGSFTWNDPAGAWSVAVLEDTWLWLSVYQRSLVAGLAGIGSLLLGAFLLQHRRSRERELGYQRELEEAVAISTKDLKIAEGKLQSLVQNGILLGREQDRHKLLRYILTGTQELTHCAAGTIYLKTERNTLAFAIVTNENEVLPSFELPLFSPETGKPNDKYVSVWAALKNESVLIDDVYSETRFDLAGTMKYSEESGFRTVSMLTVPLSPREGEVIGLLQLLNALDPETGAIIPFPPDLVGFVEALAAQSAVALENQNLLDAQKKLMESMIQLIAGAIDAKSPYTGGHCERVPELAIMLAEAASEANEGSFADFRFETEDEWREFRIGAWLHDCGKVTTPESVVDKATKLETIYNRIHEIRMRFEVLLRDAMIERMAALAAGADPAAADAAFAARKARLIDDFAFVAECNLGGEFMAPEKIERLKQIAEATWQRHFDDRLGLAHEELKRYTEAPAPLPATERLLADKAQHILPRGASKALDPRYGFKLKVPEHLYNYGELYNLSIGRGTLTEEDRFKINEHIIQTIVMLENMPFPKNLKRVPEYAATHHETLIGSGYPRQLTEAQLSIPARIMAIADIFEALTAADRPYKKAKTLSESIKILSFFKKDRHIDPELFDLFLKSGVYRRYAEKFLLPEQVDTVEIEQYLN